MERLEGSAEWLQDQTVAPAYEGPKGKAWRFTKPEKNDDPRWGLEVGDLWLIFAPYAHPQWSFHLIMAVSLAEREGVDPPIRRYPEAEYELMVWSCDPSHPAPDPREWPLGKEEGFLLQPPDVVTQFHGVTMEQAGEIVELSARACTDGFLIPDEDFRSRWDEVIRSTVSHYAV